jgi:hypothetical protein
LFKFNAIILRLVLIVIQDVAECNNFVGEISTVPMSTESNKKSFSHFRGNGGENEIYVKRKDENICFSPTLQSENTLFAQLNFKKRR